MANKQKLSNKIDKIENFDTEDLIFALDVGTRTVVGIVGVYEKECFKVIAAEVYEHKSRAMLDGQIHDINKVAEVIAEVKMRLENILGFTLTKVAIAAAGRVLKTSQTRLEYEIEQGREISSEMIGSLEVDAVQNAQMKLDNEDINEEKTPFYCVGYSVVNYYLNGFVISSLSGHKGKKIGVEVLATFLPHVVVDSLYTVMEKVGLKVVSLTLEPIAAISVTIPKDLRLLNLVLVDIGAGTSDIAVTKDGSVVAYGMVPIAGDEITEKLAQEFLVDFNTAEKIKITVSSGAETIKYTDILGKKNEISNKHALEILQPTIDLLASSISDKILEFNQKAPNAVFLIGGGCQIPGLTGKIADGLGLQIDRVAVRGRDVIHNIKTKIRKLSGPESITPFGIAMMAYTQKGQDFLSVTVNGEKVRLFNAKKLNVADALILVGYNPDMLIARTGKPLKFTLNGKQMTVKGEHGMAAEIFVNESIASLDTLIDIGDSINVKPARNGDNAGKLVIDYIKNPNGITVSLNGDERVLIPNATIDGEACNILANINDDDIVSIDEIITLSDLVQKFDLELKDSELLVNYENRSLDYVLQNNDNVTYQHANTKIEIESNVIPQNYNLLPKDMKINLEDSNKEFFITVNGQKTILTEDKAYIFVDIFSYIDFDLTTTKGNIILKLNGRPANFTDNIQLGDDIEIFWEKFKV
ncbi:MAG: cell division protein FtsA [Ruminiclostridium sp.]